MPDISMCTGESCEKKNNCYRFKANPSMRQSWMVPTPDEQSGNCDYFWKIENPKRWTGKIKFTK